MIHTLQIKKQNLSATTGATKKIITRATSKNIYLFLTHTACRLDFWQNRDYC